MNIDQFWNIIEIVKSSEEPEEDIKPELSKLSQEELESFQEHFDTLHVQAYSWKLWGAAYIIGGGCSDDGFTDFRYGLISKGREAYEKALGDPDFLATFGEESEFENELFGYAAMEVYEEKFDDDIPRSDVAHPEEPAGEEWDFDDEDENRTHLPKLAALFEGEGIA